MGRSPHPPLLLSPTIHPMNRKQYRAAGGIVLDGRGKVLLLERVVPREEGPRHEIRLPKGHLDPGESSEAAALREVCEESGYCEVELVLDLGENIVEYQHRGDQITRHERYFLMRLRRDAHRPPAVDPDSEEALFRVRWARDLDEAEQLLTYEGEKLFVRRARAAQQ